MARIKVLAIFFVLVRRTSFDWWIPYILFPDYSPNVFFLSNTFPGGKSKLFFRVFPFCKCYVYTTHDVSFYCKHCNCLFFHSLASYVENWVATSNLYMHCSAFLDSLTCLYSAYVSRIWAGNIANKWKGSAYRWPLKNLARLSK